MRNKLISFCLGLLLFAAFPLTAMAREFEPEQPGSISVTLVSQDGTKPMEGAELSVFHVATVGADENGALFYAYTDAFSDCGVELHDPELVKTLETFVSGKDIPAKKIVTDSQGKGCCENLPLGLYIVKQTEAVEGFAPCTSFLVTLPVKTDSGFMYDVDASPKTDIVRLVDITVKKVWNTDKSTAIPNSVTVQLLRQDELVETVTLNKQNDWQIICEDLPESDGYRIKEVNVPKGFTATYTHKGYEFTVTNTASLAQTGQLIWPIPVLAMAGVCLIAAGAIVLRKTRNKMRKGFGICCVILGMCCLIASGGFIAYNHWEEENAQNTSKNILQEVRESIQDNTHDESTSKESDRDESVETPMDIPQEMLTTQVDGHDCIGILSIPVLELELPVLADWSYTKLKIAPCHYFGSYFEKDFVIAAHNYQSHFGRLSKLQPKDLILFTDISGTVYCYEVVLLETLPGNATEEMVTSGFDLSLYTCTPGGGSRVTVRCNALSDL